MRSCLNQDFNFKPVVAGDLHILFPPRVTGKARLTRAGIAGSGWRSLRSATNHEPIEELTVESNVELLRPAHAHDVVLILTAGANFDDVLTVDRELMRHSGAAT